MKRLMDAVVYTALQVSEFRRKMMKRQNPVFDLEIIHLLVHEIKQILHDRLVGFYIHGSLALGDFNPESSDLDFLVVISEAITPEVFESLQQMHEQIAASENPWARKLEGSYVDMQTLCSPMPPLEPRPYLNGETFSWATYGCEWVLERYVLREHGIVIAGPELHTLLEPVSVRELQQASRQILQDWWAPMLIDPARLTDDSEYQVYAILTMCRTLYLFKEGLFVSKKKAAGWAQTHLDRRWKEPLKAALKWKHGQSYSHFVDVVDLIRFTLSEISVCTELT